MAEVTMPRLSDTMTEGVIASWLKKEGDPVKKGDVLAEIETDKATMELEVYENGVLEKILVQAGQTVPIGQVVAIVAAAGGAKASPAPATVAAPAPVEAIATPAPVAAAPVQVVAPAPVAAAVATIQSGERVKASPLARRLASEYQLDLQTIAGSGPGGRVVRDDVEAYKASGNGATVATPAPAAVAASAPMVAPTPVVAPATPPVEAAPAPTTTSSDVEIINLSMMQQTVARRLTESKQTVPHFYVSTEVDMTEAVKLREQLNSKLKEGQVKVSFNDLVVKACGIALEQMPEVNTFYKDGKFQRNKHVNIGVAVDVPNGLVVPVLHDCNQKGVRTLAKEAKALFEKARTGKLRPEDYQGGTFSVSNLGMFNVTHFQAVINPPESAILAVGAIQEKAVVINHEIVIRSRMSLTLSADHRVLYGATIARFLGLLQSLLENPFDLLG